MGEVTAAGVTSSAKQNKAGACDGAFVLPQWTIDAVVRPTLFRFFKATWGIRFVGTENIPPIDGGLIIAANHQTYVDPFWISTPVKRPLRYLAWNEAFRWPVVGRLITLLGAWPLQLEGRDPSAIRRTKQYLSEGGAVMIFPEGGRCEATGRLSRFKTGAARIALEANVPVLPVTIRGGNRVWPRGWSVPRVARRVEIVFHPTRRLTQLHGEDIRQAAKRETDALVEVIKSAL